MCHLCVGLLLAGGAVAGRVGHQQACVDEGVHDASFPVSELRQRNALAGDFLTLDRHEPEEDAQNEGDPVGVIDLGHRVVRLPRKGACHAAQFAVQLLGDGPARTGGEVELLEEVGEQRQGIVRAGVVDDGVDHARREGEVHQCGRALHDLRELAPAERADGDGVLADLGVARGQEPSEEVHPQGGEYADTRVLLHAEAKRVEELGAFPVTGESDDLFELVHHQQHASEPAAAQAGQFGPQRSGAQPQTPQDRTRGFLSSTCGCDGRGHRAQRVRPRSEGGDQRPTALSQARHDTSSDQGGLSAPGCADEHEEAAGRPVRGCVQPAGQLGGQGLPSEVHSRFVLREGVQSGVRDPVTWPVDLRRRRILQPVHHDLAHHHRDDQHTDGGDGCPLDDL
nr:hypothetical protein [Streptomyces atroolivaceus]